MEGPMFCWRRDAGGVAEGSNAAVLKSLVVRATNGMTQQALRDFGAQRRVDALSSIGAGVRIGVKGY